MNVLRKKNNRGLLLILTSTVFLAASTGSGYGQTEQSAPADTITWRAPAEMPDLEKCSYQRATVVFLTADSLKKARDCLLEFLDEFSLTAESVSKSQDTLFIRTHFSKIDSLKGMTDKLWIINSLLLKLYKSDSEFVVEIRYCTRWAIVLQDREWQTQIRPKLHQALLRFWSRIKKSIKKISTCR